MLVSFTKMEKEQYRSVIRFLFLEGKTRSEIKERLDDVYGDSSPSMVTIKNWFNEFVHGRTSVFDEPCPGASKTATTEENVKQIHDLVLADHRLKVCEIAETVGIAEGTVHHILHEELGMRKLSAQWVLFHHDNAPAHTSAVMAKLVELGYELLPHGLYSPDLAPCDFFLFPNLKKSLAENRFGSNEEVIAAMEAYFTDLGKTYVSDGLKKLEHRWAKCIELKGDYVEK
ncbi:uncharacterized protein LOC121927857 [Sceloporus undulatus]|uniref:uncharacterized protein LOC121927857 n=1 Tax=Sceloporus undulatus TaxID=8520 RepID=UPI001C4D741E|nr:uncharacterized protein LOC121927857 [Sceloporus undulatus]XP_042317755.1 uncharacterized protein LOC121927857 [Sceloporus undulatus]